MGCSTPEPQRACQAAAGHQGLPSQHWTPGSVKTRPLSDTSPAVEFYLSKKVFYWEFGISWYKLFYQFSCSVVSNSLWPHGLQHARLPCLSPTLRVYSNSCPLSQWCHPTISSSVIPFSSSFSLCQHQGLFQWVGSLHQVAKVLEFQHQSFRWISWTDFL